MGLLDWLRGGGSRVVFLGIDGVPYSMIDRHPDVFENLHRIADAGTAGPIDSIVPPESSACWPALSTGVNPGKTGVYGFQDRERNSYETYIPMGSHVRATRVWDRVVSAGRSANVFNVPVTFPPQDNVQRMVSGFLSPGIKEAAHPRTLVRELEGLGYVIDVDAKLGHDDDKAAFIEHAHRTMEGRYRAFKRYLEADDWDLFFGVFMTPDRVNHFLFGDYASDGAYREEFLEFYRTLDGYIGDLYDALDSDVSLMVASDHGFTALEHEVHLNAWLEEEGWLTYETDEPTALTDINDATRAYALIPGRIYLNLKDREPRGSVSGRAYASVRAEIRRGLESLEGPSGPVCERIIDGEEAFDGPNTSIAPDLVVIPNPGYDLKAGFNGESEVFSTGPRSGMHTFDDAALVTDMPLRLDGADLLDIAPTILSEMKVSYDETELDGRSLA